MPAPIIKGLTTYLGAQLNLNVWAGEVPRQGPNGLAIDPGAVAPNWPAVNVELPEGHLHRTYRQMGPGGTRAYGDEGPITVTVWDVTFEGVMTQLGLVEALLDQETNWRGIDLNPGSAGPFRFYQMNFASWTCVQEKEVRLGLSQLLYRGEITYDVGVHGNTQGG